jgi:hypothetical protein
VLAINRGLALLIVRDLDLIGRSHAFAELGEESGRVHHVLAGGVAQNHTIGQDRVPNAGREFVVGLSWSLHRGARPMYSIPSLLFRPGEVNARFTLALTCLVSAESSACRRARSLSHHA